MSDRISESNVAGIRELEYKASLARGERPINFSEVRELERLDVIPARELMDRNAIEQRAIQLIDAFSPETKALRYQEAEANARTAIFEALTASGHMSRVELPGRQDEVHQQVITRLLNGFYRPGIPEHERARVFQEICEELVILETYTQIVTGYLPPETKVTTISDYASPLGQDANRLGYRSANKKGMIRQTAFEMTDNGEYVRVIKQISRSNSNAETTIETLRESGVTVARRAEADVDLLGSQLIGAKIGAIDIMKRLDERAGMAVMYGEYKRSDSIGYEQLEQVSLEREARVETFIDELARVEKELDKKLLRGDIDQAMWTRAYGEKLHRIVQSICVINPHYVRDALGDRVVDEYERAHQAFLSGDSGGAAGIVSGASHMETAIVVCGMEVRNATANETNDSTRNDIEKMLERSKWEWTDGYCREVLCEFNAKITKVGPCDVCVQCQAIYDDGKTPSDIYRQREITMLESIFKQDVHDPETKRDSPKVDSLEVVETRMVIGGAIKIYRDRETGMVGTKKELDGVN